MKQNKLPKVLFLAGLTLLAIVVNFTTVSDSFLLTSQNLKPPRESTPKSLSKIALSPKPKKVSSPKTAIP